MGGKMKLPIIKSIGTALGVFGRSEAGDMA